MFILGGILFALGFLSFLGAQLQHTDFFILLPNYILMAVGAGLLFLGDWRRNKQPEKKISIFALSCFLLGFVGLLLQEGSKWLFLGISILSISCGIVFLIMRNKSQGRAVGNTLFVTGIVMSGLIFLFALASIVFNIHEEKPEGLSVESQIAFLKDGKNLVFDAAVGGKQQIFRFNLESQKAQQLTYLGENFTPSVSSLDDRVVFISGRDGNKELYVMNADGSSQKRLTNNNSEDRSPSSSPDGAKIVFQRITHTNALNIVT